MHVTKRVNLKSIIQKQEQPVTKEYVLYDSTCMTFRERQIYRDNEEINGCLGRKMNRQNAEFQDSVWASQVGVFHSVICI